MDALFLFIKTYPQNMRNKINYQACCNFIIGSYKSQNQLNHCGLVEGEAGFVLLTMFEYYRTNNYRFLELAIDSINSFVSRDEINNSLGYGLAGLAWTVYLMKSEGLLEESIVERWLNDIDKILEKDFYIKLSNNNFDYFDGASGILFYFLHSRNNTLLIRDYLSSLDSKAKRKDWSTSIHFGGSLYKCINLGVPHGLCGLLLLLLQIKEKKIDVDWLIHYLVRELMSYKTTDSFYYFGPHFWIERTPNYKPKNVLAWCYGDLSSGYAIYKAGLMLYNSELLREGMTILKGTLVRMDCVDNNFTLCHGYPSIFYIYHKLYQMTNEQKFLAASKQWQKRARMVFEQEIRSPNKINANFFMNGSLFYGFPGFFLSLFSVDNKVKILDSWDKCLLL